MNMSVPTSWLASTVSALAVVGILGGCTHVDTGTAVRADAVTPLPTTSDASTTSIFSPTTDVPESSQPGVVETTRQPVPANTATCPPPASATAVAAVADPGAPRISLTLPTGWSIAPGAGDVGARITGPAEMTGDVTITPTPLDPAAAFTKFSDDVMAKYPISSVSVLPAEVCGYSGQKLMGTWADDPDRSLQYYDRIAHVWTNTKNYLVAVHVQAPSKTDGFDEAASVLVGDFGIVLP
jgi:hypothetical protein